jgi:hypothetical protein
MPDLGHLLLGIFAICVVFIGFILLLVFLSETSGDLSGKHWSKLVVGLLATALGIRTLITGYIGHWLYSPQMSASGLQARVIGFLCLVIGFIYLSSWVKERRATGKRSAKGQ